jgi:hypothetical protein
MLTLEFIINQARKEGEDAVKLISSLVEVLKPHQVSCPLLYDAFAKLNLIS